MDKQVSLLSISIRELSVSNSWLASNECKKLGDKAKDMLRNDTLTPENVDKIDSKVPDQHKDVFWDDVASFYDKL